MTLFRNRYRVESTRLADWDYSSRSWYFVTICTKDKKCSLGGSVDGRVMLSDAGVIAEQEMKALPGYYSNVAIDRFVVMPNHVHAIVVIERDHVFSPRPARSRERSAILAVPFHERPDHEQAVARDRDYIDHNPRNWLEILTIRGGCRSLRRGKPRLYGIVWATL